MSSITRSAAQDHDHVVGFYADEGELAVAVGEFLADVLAGGRVALAVASPAHIEAFAAQLRTSGVDLDAAVAGGRLQLLDAADLLVRFMVDGRPAADRFDDVVGSLVRDACGEGRGAAIYGEMVALLWEEGNVAGAIELERLWNELGRETSFGLLCAYCRDSVEEDGYADALAELCRLHTGVVALTSRAVAASDPVERSFACDVESPKHARAFLADALEAWRLEALASPAATVMSELASNAVMHARSAFVVTLSPVSGGLRIAVRDSSPEPPVPQVPNPTRIAGRGLLIVAGLSSAWGTDAVPGGKVVWADLTGTGNVADG